MDATCSASWLNKEAWGSLMNSIHVRVADWQKDNAELRRIREAVFIAEQSVPPELEWDADDADAVHFLAYEVVAQHILLEDRQYFTSLKRLAIA